MNVTWKVVEVPPNFMIVQTGIIVTYTVRKRLSHLEITNNYEFQARN